MDQLSGGRVFLEFHPVFSADHFKVGNDGVELFFSGLRIEAIQFLLKDAEQVARRREFDVEIGHPAQESVGQVFFRVGSHDDDRAVVGGCFEAFADLRQVKAQFLQSGQHVVGQVAGGLVDLIEQYDAAALAANSGAQALIADVLLLHLFGCQRLGLGLAVLKMPQGVVPVKQVFGRRGGLGVEDDHLSQIEIVRQVVGQLGLARARLAGKQQWLPQVEGDIDRADQPFGRQVKPWVVDLFVQLDLRQFALPAFAV